MRAPWFTESATPAAALATARVPQPPAARGKAPAVPSRSIQVLDPEIEDGPVGWSESHAKAWVGLLETHRSVTRELDAKLDAEHGLTLSALEALSRLRAAEGHSLGLSALAARCALSLSRISRITDSLEARGLVERRAVDSDGRAVRAHLTDEGVELARRAQATHFAAVQRLFFERLSDGEAALLAEVFSRFAPGARAARHRTNRP
jgi:DNA-binding MarR family transcriptional regulator